MEIGTYYGKPIDEKMTKKELLGVVKYMAREIERHREREQELIRQQVRLL